MGYLEDLSFLVYPVPVKQSVKPLAMDNINSLSIDASSESAVNLQGVGNEETSYYATVGIR